MTNTPARPVICPRRLPSLFLLAWLGACGFAGTARAQSTHCPADLEQLAKYEWTGDAFAFEEGNEGNMDVVTFSNLEYKEEGEPVAADFTSEVFVSAVVVKAGRGSKTDTPFPATLEGTVTNGTLDGKAISHVLFCGGSKMLDVLREDNGVLVTPRVLLEGAFLGAEDDHMRTLLNDGGYLPDEQPYSDASYDGTACQYDGDEHFPSGALPAAGVDWVVVELRSGTAASTVVARQAALLLAGSAVTSGGTPIDPSGNIPVIAFPSVPPGDYYIVVQHRNHLPVMSAQPVALSAALTEYDFTRGREAAYDDPNVSGEPMGELSNGRTVMLAGDINCDGQIKYSGPGNDPLLIFNAVENSAIGTTSGYFRADIDVNGQVKYSGPSNDPLYIFNAVGNSAVGARKSQVPE